MPEPKQLQKYFTPASKLIVDRVWEAVPEKERQSLEEAFKGLPLDRNLPNALLDLAVIHAKTTFGKTKRIAIIGPANVGKSTLFNQFVRAKQEKAAVSPIPGTTRVNQEANAGLFNLIDTPGADAIGQVGQHEHDLALSAASQADFLLIIFDAIQGIKQTETDLYQEILALRKPFLVLMNKIDLAGKHHEAVLDKAASSLGISKDQILPISALKGDGLSNVVMSVVAADPTLTVSLAHAMPAYRQKLAWRTITTSASLSAAIALTPLPVIDFVPLVATQSGMVMTIARIYDYKITLARARELILTFGLGMIGRTLFQQLSKLGGVPGWLLSSAIASSMTVAMGYAAMQWFEKGERLNQKMMLEISRKLSVTLLARLKTAFKRKPSKKKMEDAIGEILSESNLTDTLK
ncbi:MAG: GTPase [Anaerolineaceae bacterium]|jgi:small GTP-binding protein